MSNKLEKFASIEITQEQAGKIVGGRDHGNDDGIPPDDAR